MTRYDGGRAFEYEVRAFLEAEGYWCIRAAGSHGKVDVLALKTGQILMVQCKRNGVCPPAERTELRRIAALVNAIPLIASRPRVTFRELTGNGPKDWRPWVTDFTATECAESQNPTNASKLGLSEKDDPRGACDAPGDLTRSPGISRKGLPSW